MEKWKKGKHLNYAKGVVTLIILDVGGYYK